MMSGRTARSTDYRKSKKCKNKIYFKFPESHFSVLKRYEIDHYYK